MMNGDYLEAFLRSAFSTGVTSFSSIAMSPGSRHPLRCDKRAHVFNPMRALIAAQVFHGNVVTTDGGFCRPRPMARQDGNELGCFPYRAECPCRSPAREGAA